MSLTEKEYADKLGVACPNCDKAEGVETQIGEAAVPDPVIGRDASDRRPPGPSLAQAFSRLAALVVGPVTHRTPLLLGCRVVYLP